MPGFLSLRRAAQIPPEREHHRRHGDGKDFQRCVQGKVMISGGKHLPRRQHAAKGKQHAEKEGPARRRELERLQQAAAQRNSRQERFHGDRQVRRVARRKRCSRACCFSGISLFAPDYRRSQPQAMQTLSTQCVLRHGALVSLSAGISPGDVRPSESDAKSRTSAAARPQQ